MLLTEKGLGWKCSFGGLAKGKLVTLGWANTFPFGRKSVGLCLQFLSLLCQVLAHILLKTWR